MNQDVLCGSDIYDLVEKQYRLIESNEKENLWGHDCKNVWKLWIGESQGSISKSPNIYENGKNEIFDTYTKFVEKSKQNGKFWIYLQILLKNVKNVKILGLICKDYRKMEKMWEIWVNLQKLWKNLKIWKFKDLFEKIAKKLSNIRIEGLVA